jgi:hypothetical protein
VVASSVGFKLVNGSAERKKAGTVAGLSGAQQRQGIFAGSGNEIHFEMMRSV